MKQKLETSQRSYQIFVSVTMSEKTRVGYIRDLNNFLAFTKVADYDTLAKLGIDTIQEFLEDYIAEFKRRNVTSIRTRLAGPEFFVIFTVFERFCSNSVLGILRVTIRSDATTTCSLPTAAAIQIVNF